MSQTDKTFETRVAFKSGIQFLDGSVMTTASVGSSTWASITGKPTTITGYGITDAFNGTWANLTGKPLTFPPATHNHDLLYKPIAYVPTWTEITGKPVEEELSVAIPALPGIDIPKLTTIQINALVSPVEGKLVYDITLKVMKFWNGTVWKTIITNQ
jgi:hypothetical protein